jgi:4-hydroxybenzoate polyprenyltransferase
MEGAVLPARKARPTRAGRLWDYIREMFPPAVAVPAGVASFFSIYFLLQAASGSGAGPVIVTWRAGVGAATVVLVMLLLRIFDELKDLDADKVYFPDRPVPSGRVTAQDLQALAVSIASPVMVANFAAGGVMLKGFAALFAFCLLTFRYFFVPHLIRPRILVTLATHQPLVPLTSFYCATVFARDTGASPFTRETLLAVAMFWLGGLAWEIARKIRAREDETAYVTYSRVFGTRVAPLLPAAAVAGSAAVAALGFGLPLRFSAPWFAVVGFAALVSIAADLRFAIAPTPPASRALRPATELFLTVIHVATVAEVLVRRGIAT